MNGNISEKGPFLRQMLQMLKHKIKEQKNITVFIFLFFLLVCKKSYNKDAPEYIHGVDKGHQAKRLEKEEPSLFYFEPNQ